jgi:hypothetical protein
MSSWTNITLNSTNWANQDEGTPAAHYRILTGISDAAWLEGDLVYTPPGEGEGIDLAITKSTDPLPTGAFDPANDHEITAVTCWDETGVFVAGATILIDTSGNVIFAGTVPAGTVYVRFQQMYPTSA